MEHELRCWPAAFQAMVDGYKHFELRKADRDFGEGDSLRFREWCPLEQDYTGREMTRSVVYILWSGQFGLPAPFCILALNPADLTFAAEQGVNYRGIGALIDPNEPESVREIYENNPS